MPGARVNDSTQQWAAFTPAPANGPPGAYQLTPNQTFVLYPQLANATTFATPVAEPKPSNQSGALVRSSEKHLRYLIMCPLRQGSHHLQQHILSGLSLGCHL